MGEVNSNGASNKLFLETLKENLMNLKKGCMKYIQPKESVNNKQDVILFKIIQYFDEVVDQISIILNIEDFKFNYPTRVFDIIIDSLNGLIFNDNNYIDDRDNTLINVFNELHRLSLILENEISAIEQSQSYKKAANTLNILESQQEELKNKLREVDLIRKDLENKKVNEIFEDDYEKFKKLAKLYEFSFYIALLLLFLYFFGLYIEIDTANFKFKFAEQFHGNHTPTFYVQKISLLILSTTLAAFLLKRSFMNRRLADDAYRTAKELDALPRYMEGMPEEMKEKIRFDLAYKYFGNGIHHESYTGGENLMHENIKANTDFIKAVKDLTPKAEVPKADKAPKDAA